MRNYEILFIVDSALEKEAISKVIDKLKELIDKNGGKTKGADEWGKRKLAYSVSGHTDGYYTLIDFEGETRTVKELDRVAKITDAVIRYMITRKEI